MFKEFKEFATKGNIIDLAIGVVIGGAFQKIVTSLVQDIIMPCISIITGKVDFSNMMFNVGNTSIKYGNFITTIVDFLIIAFSIFIVVRYINKLNKKLSAAKNVELEKFTSKLNSKGKFKIKNSKEEKENTTKAEEPLTKTCPYCFTEINYKATRCPNCTSILNENYKNDEIINNDLS